ncbi:hypothetical protein [Delftia acidovorans]|uniref:hypothetical protein n=1 Tax=Delftia acidovorans TaxID=80866 RepID=UPI0028EC0F5D|nr:hypothetical protein [Delftia acidovorans]
MRKTKRTNKNVEACRANARLGGLAKGESYKDKRRKAIELFITEPKMTLTQIAEKVGVSHAFVSDYTKSPFIKKLRYSQVFTIQQLLALDDEQFKSLTLQDDIWQDMEKMERIKNSDDYKQLKKDKLLKF